MQLEPPKRQAIVSRQRESSSLLLALAFLALALTLLALALALLLGLGIPSLESLVFFAILLSGYQPLIVLGLNIAGSLLLALTLLAFALLTLVLLLGFRVPSLK